MSAKAKAPYHHGDLREALLAEAPRLIAEEGLEKFTLRGLSRAVGVTHGAVYRHFGDKREMLVVLALNGHAEFSRALVVAASVDADLTDALLAVARAYVRWALSNESTYQVMFGPRLNEDGCYPELEAAIEETFRAVDALFERRSLSKARVRHLSVSLMTQLHGYCDLIQLRRIRVRSAKAAEAYLVQSISPLVAGICAEVM